jgi:tetratricopeptide (TPR) repeat protein
MRFERGLTGSLCALGLLLCLCPVALAEPTALSVGREALEAGRHGEAEAAFLDAIRVGPRSAEAHHLLGLARLGSGDAAGAVAALDESTALDPNLVGVWLSLGMARYETGDARGAEAALERAVAAQPRDASPHYFLGLSLQKLGRHRQAVEQFAKSAELDSSFEQLALLQIGVSQRELGEGEAATSALERAIEVDPESETAGHARSLLRTFESEDTTRRRWSLYGLMGLEVDDNVSVPELDASSGDADVAGVFEAGGSFRFLEHRGLEAEVGYDFYQSVYAEVTEANLQSHTFSLAGARELGSVDANLDYRFSASWLGGDGFLNVHQVYPSFGYAPLSRWYATAGYDFRDKDFRIDGGRDATQHAGVFRNFFLLGEGQTLDLLYRIEDENARASEFDYLGQVVGVRLVTPVAPFGFALDLELGYRFDYRDYSNQTPSIGERREDKRHFADFVVERRLTDLLVARLTYQHFTSDSNLPSADYTSNIVNLVLGFEI